MIRKEDALHYHEHGRRGKIEVVPTKPLLTRRDLALAFGAGAMEASAQIQKLPRKVFDYTARGNLVAVITNGSAIAGVGKVGALAAKPVMEGRVSLFKKFADIDAVDLELDCDDPEAFIETVVRLEPTFGGINLHVLQNRRSGARPSALQITHHHLGVLA